MALRRRNDTSIMAKQRETPPATPGQVNIIGHGTTIEGGISASTDVRIAGTVIGNVRVSGKTVVTPEGEVNGEIRSTSGDIAGRVKGEVIMEERLLLKDSARIEGNLYTKKLVIEEGAVFTGSCDMSGMLPSAEPEASPKRLPSAEPEVEHEGAGQQTFELRG